MKKAPRDLRLIGGLLAEEVRASPSPYVPAPTAEFVGEDLSLVPALSGFGVLLRLVRLNCLVPHDLFPLLRLRVNRDEDLTQILTFSAARQTAFAGALHNEAVPSEWDLSSWFPFQAPTGLLKDRWRFRFCKHCLACCYHSLLHQMPWVHRCPWHDVELQTNCTKCGSSPPVASSWSAANPLMRCACGHDPVDMDRTFTAMKTPLGAGSFSSAYLSWAAQQRNWSVLAAPDDLADAGDALAELVRLPGELDARCQHSGSGVHRRTLLPLRQPRGPDTPLVTSRLDALWTNGWIGSKGAMAVPKGMQHAITAVSSRAVSVLAAHGVTDREIAMIMTTVGGGMVGNVQRFLNLSSIQHPGLSALRHLEQPFAKHGYDAGLGDSAADSELLHRAACQVLSRAYAEYIYQLGSTHLSALSGGPKRTGLTHPWMIVRREQDAVSSIEIAWHPAS